MSRYRLTTIAWSANAPHFEPGYNFPAKSQGDFTSSLYCQANYNGSSKGTPPLLD